MYDDGNGGGYNNGPPPPRWAWHDWKHASQRSGHALGGAPTLDDFRRAGLVHGDDAEFGGAPEDHALIHPAIAAAGAVALLWWLSRR